MMETTERLALPLLAPGQAQKELFHNEALQLIDVLAAPAVEDLPSNDPPSEPVPGRCYLVGPSPGGEWAGLANHIAACTSAGWRFVAPAEGLAPLVKATSTRASFGSSGWEIGVVRGSSVVVDGAQVVGAQAPAIADPAGGTVVDEQSRATLAAILTTLRQHGLISS